MLPDGNCVDANDCTGAEGRLVYVSDDGSERRCLSNRVGCAARHGYVLAG